MAMAIKSMTDSSEIISFNPANGAEVGRVKNCTPDEVGQAVAAARKAFEVWRNTSFAERKDIVMKAREVILSELDGISRLISDEMGKPVAEAFTSDIAPVLDLMQYFARNTAKILKPKKIGIGLYGLLGRSSKMIYQPLGVVGIISPWNFPLSIPLGEATMALMAGNAVVLKPSEWTPLVGEKIGDIFAKAGLPNGVLQIVTGDGKTGAALVDSGVDRIMFTGSVATGKRIAEAAAKTLTPVVLELGGKGPMVVCEDANLDLASSAAVWGAFFNSGQACSSVERVYADERIAPEFTRLVVEKTNCMKQNSGSDTDAEIAAMVNENQLKIVESQVESFRQEGAEILTGGRRNPDLNGIFFEPTVIGGADNSMRGMREETFGPTMPIATFRTEDEAIHLANDTEFGLTASVWTRDVSRGQKLAGRIRAGTVMVNEVVYTHGIGQTPWGGFKNSGYGRTHGKEGLFELVAVQHIHTSRIMLMKDLWWYPYSPDALETFKGFCRYWASGSLLKVTAFLPQLLKRMKEQWRSRS